MLILHKLRATKIYSYPYWCWLFGARGVVVPISFGECFCGALGSVLWGVGVVCCSVGLVVGFVGLFHY